MRRPLTIALPLLLLLAGAGPPQPAEAAGGAEVLIEDFRDAKAFYETWNIKKWDSVVQLSFVNEGSGPFLRLICDNASWAFLRKLEVDLEKTPLLSWSWRADVLPSGGDGRHAATEDEAAQMYVFFPGAGAFPRLNPCIVGYTWETVPEPGTRYVSPKNDNTRIVVLRNAKDGLGVWKREERDVAADFRKAFGAPPPKPDAICFQIDSTDTATKAESCFADIRFRCR
jgi:hypothetical protein